MIHIYDCCLLFKLSKSCYLDVTLTPFTTIFPCCLRSKQWGLKIMQQSGKQSSGQLNKLLFSKKAFNSNKQQDSVEEGVSSSCAHARFFSFFSFQKHAWQHCFSAFLKDRWLSWTGGCAVLMNGRLFNKNFKWTASRIQRLWRASGGLYNFPGKAVGALGQNPCFPCCSKFRQVYNWHADNV